MPNRKKYCWIAYTSKPNKSKSQSWRFGTFWVLHLVDSQAYKLKLPKIERYITFFMSHHWSRILQEKSKWQIQKKNWNSMLKVRKSIMWRLYRTAYFLLKSWNWSSYQSYTISFFEKNTQEKKTSGSPSLQSST